MVRKRFSNDLAISAGIDQGRFPESTEEVEAAEAALSAELENLSLQEREQVVFEVHGFSKLPPEDPKVLQTKLKELGEELARIKKKPAYDRAAFFDKKYVEQDDFRLMFLRCESFEVGTAAELMVQHFEMKRELFGNDAVLGRDIHRSDLTEKAREILDQGVFVELGSRDTAGRTVIFLRQWLGQLPIPDLNQAIWYFRMAVLRDVETQRSGYVMVIGNYTSFVADMDFLQRVHKCENVLPLRLEGIHYCYDDVEVKGFATGLQLFLNKETRIRLRQHFGPPQEVYFRLQTFGIPMEDAPLQPDGSWSFSWHREWLQVHQLREQKAMEEMERLGVIIPARFDVLFGKTKSAKEHTGNLRLLHLCDIHSAEYDSSTSKYQKSEISDRLISIVRQSQGRFLKWNDTGWIEVDDVAARDKIAHLFRHRRVRTANHNQASKRSTEKPNPAPKRSTPSPSAGN